MMARFIRQREHPAPSALLRRLLGHGRGARAVLGQRQQAARHEATHVAPVNGAAGPNARTSLLRGAMLPRSVVP